MKIGFFLAYHAKVNLKIEGLGRYLAKLIKSFLSLNQEIVIACPKWSIASLQDLFEDNGIDVQAIEWIVLQREPVFWGIINLFSKTEKKKRKIRFFYVENLIDWIIGKIVTVSNLFLFLLIFLLLTLAGMLVIVPSIMFAICYLILQFAKKNAKGSFKKIYSIFNKIYKRLKNKNQDIGVYAMEQILNFSQIELVKKINRYNHSKIDVWFSPSAFWPSFNKINGLTVVNTPDLVTTRFPQLFSEEDSFVVSTQRVSKTLRTGKYFISYCEYLRKTFLQEEFSIEKSHSKAIAHSINDMSSLIEIDPIVAQQNCAQKNLVTAYSRYILNALKDKAIGCGEYLYYFDFSDVNYLFYASQYRPHKNILQLIQVYQYLLRNKYKNLKLFLTANVYCIKEVERYIVQNRLQYDVICFCNVSSLELAALYHCADLVVNPTLYEGGFPFTFGEGMSVGTPSVMSKIPQVTEVTDGFDLEEMLFDPYDWEDMARCIEHGLDHREELYQKQLPLYQELSKRTQEVVAQEYINAFEEFIALEKNS